MFIDCFAFLSFCELFPAFSRAKESGSLLSICYGVSIFNPCPPCFFHCSADSPVSKSCISVVSSCSSLVLSSDSS